MHPALPFCLFLLRLNLPHDFRGWGSSLGGPQKEAMGSHQCPLLPHNAKEGVPPGCSVTLGGGASGVRKSGRRARGLSGSGRRLLVSRSESAKIEKTSSR